MSTATEGETRDGMPYFLHAFISAQEHANEQDVPVVAVQAQNGDWAIALESEYLAVPLEVRSTLVEQAVTFYPSDTVIEHCHIYPPSEGP